MNNKGQGFYNRGSKMKQDDERGIWERMWDAVSPAPAQAEKTHKPFSPEHKKAARENLVKYFRGEG